MFLHVKSPIHRDEVTDILLNIHDIQAIDMFKKKREGEVVYHLLFITSDGKGHELHPTLESAQNRMKDVLMMVGETEENATKISSDFVPEDRTSLQDLKEHAMHKAFSQFLEKMVSH